MPSKRLNYALILFLLATLAFADADARVWAQEKLKVAVSIAPLASLVRTICGDAASVELLSQESSDPHAFEPRPSDLARLSRADLAVFFSPLLEQWAKNLQPSATTALIWLAGEDEQARDVHYWLVPPRMAAYADKLTGALCLKAPEQCGAFQRALTDYKASLGRLDQTVATLISGWPRRSFVADHPAWQAFAEHYGLKQLALLREGETDEISPRQLANLLTALPANETTVFIVEQSAVRSVPAEFLEKARLRQVVLDSFGSSDTPYEQLIMSNVSKLKLVMDRK